MMNGLMRIVAMAFLCGACAGCEKEKGALLTEPGTSLGKTDTLETKDPSPEWLDYRIAAGGHESDLRSLRLFEEDEMAFQFVFDSSAIYQTSDPANQKDWNKLMGFSDCGSFHQQNSIRLVWRYLEENIEIGEYRYTDGVRQFSTLTAVLPGDTGQAYMGALENRYLIRVNEAEVERPRNCSSRTGSYWLYPYFGGDEVAPHDILIQVRHF